jgi:hypothetical protein
MFRPRVDIVCVVDTIQEIMQVTVEEPTIDRSLKELGEIDGIAISVALPDERR